VKEPLSSLFPTRRLRFPYRADERLPAQLVALASTETQRFMADLDYQRLIPPSSTFWIFGPKGGRSIAVTSDLA
jgi:hypothetical protein